MTLETETALQALAALGFRGRDIYMAELIPAVEMAWADGRIQPNELALLKAYCEALTERLNRHAGAGFFQLRHSLEVLGRLTRRRLLPHERLAALAALKAWSGESASGAERRKEMLEWASAVAAIDGRPVWDTRELFWLNIITKEFGECV